RRAIERRRAVIDQFAVADEIDPGRRDAAQWRQSERIDHVEACRNLPGERQQQERQIAGGGLRHGASVSCALIASMRTRFQRSSTFSTNSLLRRMLGSRLPNLVSTIALIRPGRADMTATRSA